MGRTLLRVPRMFTRDDLSRIDPRLPDDYDSKAKEFWDYVGARFSSLGGRLKRIYLESTGVMGKRHLELLKMSDPLQFEVVNSAVESGAGILEAEDPELVLETLSWLQRMQEMLAAGKGEDTEDSLKMIGEMLQESLKERDAAVSKAIDESLKEGEAGALIMDMSRQIDLPTDIRVVITCPLRPRDYLNSWLAGLRARDQAKAAEESEDKAETKEEKD